MKPFDASGAFRPGIDGSGMRQLAVRGAAFTLLSGGAGMGVQLVATVVLARLLTPADFGVVAMVTTFSLLLTNFGLNGFTEAIQQREEINHSLVSNLFWINAGAGLALAALFAAAGSLMARFYADAKVAQVAAAMSSTIFINSLSVEHLALLKRAMRFSAVSANDISARAISVAVSIALGWAGWGYWALVAGAIALPLSITLGAWWQCRWIPGLPRNVAGTGAMVRFAVHVYGRFSFNYFTRNLDNLLVGWRFGPVALGFYKKAYDLFLLSAAQISAPLTSVAVSALSRFDGRSAQYRRHLLSTLSVLAFVGMGLGAGLTLVGKDVIRLVLGPGWDTAGRIFMYFGPGIGVMLLYYTHGWIHLSIGEASRWFRWVVVEFAVTAALFLIGLHWGPVGVAVAWTASFWILTLPGFWYAGKPIGFGVGPVIAAVWKFTLASLVAGGAAAAIVRATWSFAPAASALHAFTRIAENSLLFTVLYLAMVVALHRGLAPLRQLRRLVEEMIPGRGLLPSSPAAAASGVAGFDNALASKPENRELLIR